MVNNGMATLSDTLLFSIFIIFTGAALVATLALYARQSLLVAYIAVGVLAGPAVTGLVTDHQLIEEIAHVGIIFLLFLLGLDLYPQKLIKLLKETTGITLASTVVFGLLGYVVADSFGFTRVDCLLVGMASTLSNASALSSRPSLSAKVACNQLRMSLSSWSKASSVDAD